MIRRDDARTTVHVARFAFEFVLAPCSRCIGKLCVGAFDDDFEAFARDGAERTVGVDEVQRLEAGVHELSA